MIGAFSKGGHGFCVKTPGKPSQGRLVIMERRSGFTLVELMIVVAIIAVIIGFAIPSLFRAYISANEKGAITFLRALVADQASFKTAIVNDQNMNGSGEYGFLQELSGAIAPRDQKSALQISGEFIQASYGEVNAAGEASHRGYYFKLYILQSDMPIAFAQELPGVVPPLAGPSADLAESFWVCFAWPMTRGRSGKRAFCSTNDGLIYCTQNDSLSMVVYSGTGAGPAPTAPFDPAQLAMSVLAFSSPGVPASDGNVWTPL